MAMNNTRFQAIYKALPQVVQRTYEGVPNEGAKDAQQIHADLVRMGLGRDFNNTRGCLNHLVETRVVMESPRGYFTRVPVRGAKAKEKVMDTAQETTMDSVARTIENWDDEPDTKAAPIAVVRPHNPITFGSGIVGALPPTTTPPETTPEPTPAPTPAPVKAKVEPIEQLVSLSGRVRNLSVTLKELADDIDNAALDITEQMTMADDNMRKLKTLQTLLKDLV